MTIEVGDIVRYQHSFGKPSLIGYVVEVGFSCEEIVYVVQWFGQIGVLGYLQHELEKMP